MEYWTRIVENNEIHALPRGYYVTRLASSYHQNQNVSGTEARQLERNFFEKVWPESPKARLGTEKLVEGLSVALTEMIEDRLGFLWVYKTNCKDFRH